MITEKQKNFLLKYNFTEEEINKLSKADASDKIGLIILINKVINAREKEKEIRRWEKLWRETAPSDEDIY